MAAIRQRPLVLLMLLLVIVEASGERCARYQDSLNRTTLSCRSEQGFLDSGPYDQIQVFFWNGTDGASNAVDWKGYLAVMPNVVEATFTNMVRVCPRTHPLLKLEKLDLSHNKIGEICINAFDNMANLRVLNLSHNRLEQLPSYQFKKLTQLHELDLSYNHLTSISASAFSELECHTLKLNNNRLNTTELGSALSGLHGLVELDLSSNNFKSLPADMFTAIEHSLERLDLSNNRLTELPKLPEFEKIKDLDFSINQITSISKGGFVFTEDFWHRMENREIYLYLQENPFTCYSCDFDVLKFFEGKNYKCKESDEYCLRCIAPINLFNQKIVDLPAGNSSLSSECEAVMAAVRGQYPTKGNFIYFLLITILTVVFFVSLVLLFVFRKKVFRSNHRIGELRVKYFANATNDGYTRFLPSNENESTDVIGADPTERKLVDGDEQVQSNGKLSNKSDKEICLSRLDPSKFANSNSVTDSTKECFKLHTIV